MATITIPKVGTYVKVKANIPERDGILRRLRGAYGTSTKKAFKVVGYSTTIDKQNIQLIVENTWGLNEWVDINCFDIL